MRLKLRKPASCGNIKVRDDLVARATAIFGQAGKKPRNYHSTRAPSISRYLYWCTIDVLFHLLGGPKCSNQWYGHGQVNSPGGSGSWRILVPWGWKRDEILGYWRDEQRTSKSTDWSSYAFENTCHHCSQHKRISTAFPFSISPSPNTSSSN